jgi:hypothetical protein
MDTCDIGEQINRRIGIRVRTCRREPTMVKTGHEFSGSQQTSNLSHFKPLPSLYLAFKK